MQVFNVKGLLFEFDDSKEYFDFYISNGKYNLEEVNWQQILKNMENGVLEPSDITHDLTLLDRWITDAPRKRTYRKMKAEGFNVLSNEYWFENIPDDEAERIFVALENSGHLARRFLETFLPQLAETCKKLPHPAANFYIDP